MKFFKKYFTFIRIFKKSTLEQSSADSEHKTANNKYLLEKVKNHLKKKSVEYYLHIGVTHFAFYLIFRQIIFFISF